MNGSFAISHQFAHRDVRGELCHVFPSKGQVRMCGNSPIVPVTVREAKEDEPETHWGWLDKDRTIPSIIWPTLKHLEMCFPYGIEVEIKRGAGRPVRLVIEEVTA